MNESFPSAKAAPFPPLAHEPNQAPGLWASFLFGFYLAKSQLSKRRMGLTFFLAFALAISSALIEKYFTQLGAVDRALESTFRLLIPLLCFAILSEITGRADLRDAAWPMARFGANHRDIVMGMLAASVLASALFSAALALVSVIAAHSKSAPPILSDAMLSAWIAMVTALAYTGYYALGATFFRFGRGRFVPLIIDFLFGGSVGLIGALLPRGNAINLLGGPAPMGLSQSKSFVLLLVMGAFTGGLALMRCRR